jgi:hypothetical protein
MEKIYVFEHYPDLKHYELISSFDEPNELQELTKSISRLQNEYYEKFRPLFLSHLKKVIDLGLNQYLNKPITSLEIETGSEYNDEGGYFDIVEVIHFYDEDDDYVRENNIKKEYQNRADDIAENFDSFRFYIDSQFSMSDLSSMRLLNQRIDLDF